MGYKMIKNKIKELRTSYKMTQQELADVIKISKRSLNYYEKFEIDPPLHVLIKIANYFDVTIDYLVGRGK